MQGRYVTPKGSIRTALEPTSESSLTQWLMKWLNKMGHGHRDYSLFLFHKKGSFRKNVKKVVKSRYPSTGHPSGHGCATSNATRYYVASRLELHVGVCGCQMLVLCIKFTVSWRLGMRL